MMENNELEAEEHKMRCWVEFFIVSRVLGWSWSWVSRSPDLLSPGWNEWVVAVIPTECAYFYFLGFYFIKWTRRFPHKYVGGGPRQGKASHLHFIPQLFLLRFNGINRFGGLAWLGQSEKEQTKQDRTKRGLGSACPVSIIWDHIPSRIIPGFSQEEKTGWAGFASLLA